MPNDRGRSAAESPTAGAYQESALFALSGASADEVREGLCSLRRAAEQTGDEKLGVLAAQRGPQNRPEHPVRAAVVCTSLEELAARTGALENLLADEGSGEGQLAGGPKDGFWLGKGLPQLRVAFLFPGQGSQQVNMARRLVERFSWARSLVEQADTWVQEAGGESVSELVFRPHGRAADKQQSDEWYRQLSQTETAQPAVCLASLLWATHLGRLGLEPTAVGGHSLGELTAFCAAGAFDARDLLRLATVRGKAMATQQDAAGTMASLACSREQAEAILRQVDAYVTLANINSPRQSVVSGEQRGIQEALLIAEKAGIAGRELAVSNAFHSRLVGEAAEHMRTHAPIPETLHETTSLLLSGMDGRRVPLGTDLRQYFSRQVLSQVDFAALLQSVVKACDVMLEVGPGRVLSGLVRQNLGAGGPSCLPVESLAGSDRDLHAILATLFVHRHVINWQEL